MRYNDATFLEQVIGMPDAHAEAFLNVARSQKCVIVVRATGPTCLTLLAEGYDTKGYRIHGKSCDWGPMAGFVLRDPRLNKNGADGEQFNREKHHEAMTDEEEGQGWTASTTPLFISRDRINWLLNNLNLPGLTDTPYGFRGQARRGVVVFNYALRREGGLYSVCFDHTRNDTLPGGRKFVQETGRPYVGTPDYEPLLAMTNPLGHGIGAGDAPHLQAITGDYDLFAVWPYKANYNAGPGGADHRPLGTVRGSNSLAERQNVTQLERHFTQGDQGTKMGNITNRIYLVCQLINSIVGRHVLWHSDEAARPFLSDVDLPVIAFNPAGTHFGIETIHDFQVFIAACLQEDIHVSLSNAWAQNPTPARPNRLGAGMAGYVPADGVRIIVPDWYNA